MADGPAVAAGGGVWLLQPMRGPVEPALAVAERLGVAFRQVPLEFGWAGRLGSLWRGGSLLGLRNGLPAQAALPAVTLSYGRAAGRIAAWLRRRTGSLMVHCGPAGLARGQIDLRVIDAPGEDGPGLMPVLGDPHRLSPLALATTRMEWRERLDHLPRPRLALFMGGIGHGFELSPQAAFTAARSIAAAVAGAQGAVLAVAEPGIGREATDALAAGLQDSLHLLYRTDEPGPDAALGFLASADAVVVAGHVPQRLLQVCAANVPVYALPITAVRLGLGCPLQRRLIEGGHVRLLEDRIGRWERPRLDEAGRVARRIHELVRLED